MIRLIRRATPTLACLAAGVLAATNNNDWRIMWLFGYAAACFWMLRAE